MTFRTEVSIRPASERSSIAAEVALELDVAEAVLVASELLLDAHIMQATALAHELLRLHAIFLLSLHIISKLLVPAVNIAAKEGFIAARAFVKLTDAEGILERLLIEAIAWVLQPRIVLQIVKLELSESVFSDSALEDDHSIYLLTDLWHNVRALNSLLTARALHEVESDALGAPTVTQKLSNATCMEDMSTF